MALASPNHVLVVGAGAAGLMAGLELTRAGKRVTILEARERCGGRIWALPAAEFGYAAEGGPEFVHGAAPVTREVMRAAGLSLAPFGGRRWLVRGGVFSTREPAMHEDRLQEALATLQQDLPIMDFLAQHFAAPEYAELRQSITRRVEGYDAADPRRASTFAVRDEWMDEGPAQQGRIAEGYGALIDYLAAECRTHGATIHFGAVVTAIDDGAKSLTVRCRDGAMIDADAVVLTLPLPLWRDIALPAAVQTKIVAGGDIGFGNVIKLLLRFRTRWWVHQGGRDLADLSFLLADTPVPTWWTQYPVEHAVLTGWYAGPKADKVATLTEDEMVDMGLASLGAIFSLPPADLKAMLIAARAIDWGKDPFARGAYSYATPETRAARVILEQRDGSGIFFAGEALYAGRDMGTVEAALATGQAVAQRILSGKA